jgi:hypothetical protein
MAMHSNYIDTMLATRMREGKTLELTLTDFPDDRPVCVWDIMVDFVTDPSKACDMTLQHALMVAETYNQYDFLQGRCLCDKVVLKYMESLKQQERDETLDIGVWVDALSISFAANLTSSYQKGSEFIQPILNQKQILEFYCPLMFSESLVEKLVPVLLDLVEKNPSLELLPTRAVSAEDIKSRLFPRLYTAEWEAYSSRPWIHANGFSCIELTGSGIPGVDGVFSCSKHEITYERSHPVPIEGVESKIVITWERQKWKIYATVESSGKETLLWSTQFNATMSLPPRRGWMPVHIILAGEGKPVINYIHSLDGIDGQD